MKYPPTRKPSSLVVLLLVVAAPGVASAKLMHPASWKQVSDDGRYVLVMVSPLAVGEDAGHSAFDSKEIRRIRATYSRSGLYRNNGTTKPLWTIPYSDWTHKVYITPDGKHLVIADDNWRQSNLHVASFYANGRQLASYGLTDLVLCIRIKSWISGQMFGCGGIDFDADALTFASRTNQGEEFVFDVTTGNVVRHSSPFPVYIMIGPAGIVMAVIFLVVLRSGIRRSSVNGS